MARATTKTQTGKSLFTAELIIPAIGDAFKKLHPRALIRNPVMFVTACVALLMTILLVVGGDSLGIGFKLQLAMWLWLTVLFGTFAEALAEGRGKAQAASLRATKAELSAKRLKNGHLQQVPASQLCAGDIVLVDYKTGGKNKAVTNVNESIQLNVYVIAARIELQKEKPFGIEPVPGEDWKNKKIKTASFFYPEKEHLDTDTDGVQLSKSATGKADGQWFDYLVNDTDVEAAKKKLVDIKQAIDNGEFGAKPEGFTCKYCDFNDICEESVAR